MTSKRNILVPALLIAALGLTRLLVGVMPNGFSAIYALAFCGAVYFRGAVAWWLPFGTLVASDIILNVFFYAEPVIGPWTFVSYGAFALIILIGRQFKTSDSWLKLLSGGLMGAVLFYLITNTFSWMENIAYAKSFAGWIQALTVGEPGYPPTWVFFRNSLLSGGLFTGLFVGSMKLAEAAETKEATKPEEEAAETPEAEPENGNA